MVVPTAAATGVLVLQFAVRLYDAARGRCCVSYRVNRAPGTTTVVSNLPA
jgi:hypothetical protein